MNHVLPLLAGLLVLLLGAEALVRGASQLARIFRIPPLLIGLTVVAFGTSAPELAVSVKAALGGSSDIALGNVVGSNIFNVLFILGICAVFVPLRIDEKLLRFDAPAMIGVSFLLFLFAGNGFVGRGEALVLVLGLLGYISLIFIRAERGSLESEVPLQGFGAPMSIILAAGGLFLLVRGAENLVNASVELARLWGVSELVIGLTIVAAGTSLPEVATSLVASLRGERDLAVGNVVGSNIFNILCVLGFSALITPLHVAPEALLFTIPVMVTVAVLCYPVFWSRGHIDRIEGALLLASYAAFCSFLICDALFMPAAERIWWHVTIWILPLIILAYTGTFGRLRTSSSAPLSSLDARERQVLAPDNPFELMRQYLRGGRDR